MIEKAPGALLTIGEVASMVDLPQHVLRYWERCFPNLRPMTRAGRRRNYRPVDVEMVRTIKRLLHDEGYTIAGARTKLGLGAAKPPAPPASDDAVLARLMAIRDRLAAALDGD